MIRVNAWIGVARERRLLLPLVVLVAVVIVFAAAFHEHDELVEAFIGVVVVLTIAAALSVVVGVPAVDRGRWWVFWLAASGLRRGPPGRPRGPTGLAAGFSPGAAPLLR